MMNPFLRLWYSSVFFEWRSAPIALATLLFLLPLALLAQPAARLHRAADSTTHRTSSTIDEERNAQRGLYGYQDASGNWAIPPRFDRAYDFHGGRALVAVTDSTGWVRYGVIDERGEWIIPPLLSTLTSRPGSDPGIRFNDGIDSDRGHSMPIVLRYLRLPDGTMAPTTRALGEIEIVCDCPGDSTEQETPPPPPMPLSDSCCHAVVEEGLRYCIMDSTWNVSVWDIEDITYWSQWVPRIGAMVDGKWGMIGGAGEWIVPPTYRSFLHEYAYPILVENDRGYLYIDSMGRVQLPGPYQAATTFRNGHAAVRVDGRYGIIDSIGAWRQQALYDTIDVDVYGIYRASRNGRWSLFDMTGRSISSVDFDERPEPFEDGSWLVTHAGCWGVIDDSGRVLFKIDSEEPITLLGDSDDRSIERWATFKHRTGWGVRTSHGRTIHSPTLPIEPVKCWDAPWVIYISDGSRMGLIDTSGSMLLAPKLDSIVDVQLDENGAVRYVLGFHEGEDVYIDLRDPSKTLLHHSSALYRLTTKNGTRIVEIRNPSMRGITYQRTGNDYELRANSNFTLYLDHPEWYEPDILHGRFSSDYRQARGFLHRDDDSISFRMEHVATVQHERRVSMNLDLQIPMFTSSSPSIRLFQRDIIVRISSQENAWQVRHHPTYDSVSMAVEFELYYLDSNRISYRIGTETNEGSESAYRNTFFNTIIEDEESRDLEWSDLVRDGVSIDTLRFCPKLGMVTGEQWASNDSCDLYTLGTSAFLLEETGLRVVYDSLADDDEHAHETDGYFIPYELLEPYIEPRLLEQLRSHSK